MRGMSTGSMFFWKHTRREKKKGDDASESSHATGPYRDSFRVILPTTPRYDKPLHRLRISLVDWRVFVELLLVSSFVVCPIHLNAMFAQSLILEDF